MSIVLFAYWPYIALTVFVVGHVWRWRQDQFGWTTRTSQLMEKRWLMLGSPLFHVGLLFVVLGHGLGLVVPASVTAAFGITQEMYHVVALSAGILAGVVACAGLVILLARRFVTKARLRIVTRRADVAMYVLLGLVAFFGMWNTLGVNLLGGGYDYRATVGVWFRSLFTFQPDPALMAGAPWSYQVHAIAAFGLFAIWPFTRLVHLWSIPLGYLLRPLIVYRANRVPR